MRFLIFIFERFLEFGVFLESGIVLFVGIEFRTQIFNSLVKVGIVGFELFDFVDEIVVFIRLFDLILIFCHVRRNDASAVKAIAEVHIAHLRPFALDVGYENRKLLSKAAGSVYSGKKVIGLHRSIVGLNLLLEQSQLIGDCAVHIGILIRSHVVVKLLPLIKIHKLLIRRAGIGFHRPYLAGNLVVARHKAVQAGFQFRRQFYAFCRLCNQF